MQSCIDDLVPRVALQDRNDHWWRTVKASDEFLDRLFDMYFEKLDLMRKTDYHVLARMVPNDLLDDQVTEKLDAIVDVAESAHPL
jgi:hypothetical protein